MKNTTIRSDPLRSTTLYNEKVNVEYSIYNWAVSLIDWWSRMKSLRCLTFADSRLFNLKSNGAGTLRDYAFFGTKKFSEREHCDKTRLEGSKYASFPDQASIILFALLITMSFHLLADDRQLAASLACKPTPLLQEMPAAIMRSTWKHTRCEWRT